MLKVYRIKKFPTCLNIRSLVSKNEHLKLLKKLLEKNYTKKKKNK